MNKSNVLISVVTSVVVMALGFMLFGGGKVVERVEKVVNLGGGNPEFSTPYLRWGDVSTFRAKTSALTQATTTICALQSPAATSTLTMASINLSVSSSTASVLTLAKAATAFATTTALNTIAIGANAQGVQVATSSVAAVGIVDNNVFAPNRWFVVGMQGGIGTFSPTGVCSAEWTVISQ